jgi:ribosomal-protein-alanine N-acetyltransferase
MMVPTQRLELKEAEFSHAIDLATYHNDKRYLEHYTESPDTVALIALFKKWAAATPRRNHQFILVLRGCGTAIGCAALRMEGRPTGEAELGVELNPDYWRQGYAREAVSTLLELGRTELGVARFLANTANTNRSAQRVLEEFNFSCVESQGDKHIYSRKTHVF